MSAPNGGVVGLVASTLILFWTSVASLPVWAQQCYVGLDDTSTVPARAFNRAVRDLERGGFSTASKALFDAVVKEAGTSGRVPLLQVEVGSDFSIQAAGPALLQGLGVTPGPQVRLTDLYEAIEAHPCTIAIAVRADVDVKNHEIESFSATMRALQQARKAKFVVWLEDRRRALPTELVINLPNIEGQ